MKVTQILSGGLLAVCLAVTGCTNSLSPNNYNGSDVGSVSTVKKGVIVSMRQVNIDNNSGVGGLAGTVGGAAAGSMIGTNTASTILGAVAGGVVGGLAGSAIDQKVNGQQGFEYIIKLTGTNNTISVTQAADGRLQVNERVLVIYGKMTRIVPDNTYSG